MGTRWQKKQHDKASLCPQCAWPWLYSRLCLWAPRCTQFALRDHLSADSVHRAVSGCLLPQQLSAPSFAPALCFICIFFYMNNYVFQWFPSQILNFLRTEIFSCSCLCVWCLWHTVLGTQVLIPFWFSWTHEQTPQGCGSACSSVAWSLATQSTISRRFL